MRTTSKWYSDRDACAGIEAAAVWAEGAAGRCSLSGPCHSSKARPGRALISIGVLSLTLGALLCLWLSEKFAGWQSKFLYSDYDHTAKG